MAQLSHTVRATATTHSNDSSRSHANDQPNTVAPFEDLLVKGFYDPDAEIFESAARVPLPPSERSGSPSEAERQPDPHSDTYVLPALRYDPYAPGKASAADVPHPTQVSEQDDRIAERTEATNDAPEQTSSVDDDDDGELDTESDASDLLFEWLHSEVMRPSDDDYFDGLATRFQDTHLVSPSPLEPSHPASSDSRNIPTAFPYSTFDETANAASEDRVEAADRDPVEDDRIPHAPRDPAPQQPNSEAVPNHPIGPHRARPARNRAFPLGLTKPLRSLSQKLRSRSRSSDSNQHTLAACPSFLRRPLDAYKQRKASARRTQALRAKAATPQAWTEIPAAAPRKCVSGCWRPLRKIRSWS